MLARKILLVVALLLTAGLAHAQQAVGKDSFAVVNLDYPGLEKVKQQVAAGKYDAAAAQLLDFYRNRTGLLRPDFDMAELKASAGKTLKPDLQEAADNALLHKFKPHKAYGYYDFGANIDWQLRPVPDQLFNTFLHRTAIWEPLGKAYWASGDEKYAKAWVAQFRDYVKSNRKGAYPDDAEYAWKPFVVSFRLNYWSSYFNVFLKSPSFTPEFLMEFLNAYAVQADYVLANYTDIGNHRLFEAEHMMYAGYSLPQLRQAPTWRNSAVAVLNEEIGKQVLPDGVDFELSTSYHITVLNIFLDALEIARQAGADRDFPASYRALAEKMVLAVGKYSFPDYSYPLYGNSFLGDKQKMLQNYRGWSEVFPDNGVIRWYASDGKSGTAPEYRSSALPDAGFYALRSGGPLDMDSIVMQVKAGPPAFFHSHPDNGNFVLWVKGRNFTPDSGSFVYANVGDQKNAKRDWYRASSSHQTLTLDDRDIQNKARLLKWQADGDVQVLSYANPSYEHLDHQRSFVFVDNKFFIIVDKASGDAAGKLGVHFNLKEGSSPVFDEAKNAVTTGYRDHNNLLIQNFNADAVSLRRVDSFVSYEYQKETPRPAFVFEKRKADAKPQTFVTVIYPYADVAPLIAVKENAGNDLVGGTLDLTMVVDGVERRVQASLQP